MNFYLDFEAAQFSNQIISVGCVSENGDVFQSLVKPPKGSKKVTKFITDLTGITNEMLENADDADGVFSDLFYWVMGYSKNEIPHYFCYGDGDQKYLESTVQHMKEVFSISFVYSIKALLVDYSVEAKRLLSSKNPIALNRIYNLLKEEENVQKHDALEDALMLQYVAKNLTEKYSVADVPAATPRNTKHAPEIFINWPNDKFAADTFGEPGNWTVKAEVGPYVKWFDTMDTAVLWALRYLTKNKSPKKENDLITVEEQILSSIKKGKCYCGFKWTVKGND